MITSWDLERVQRGRELLHLFQVVQQHSVLMLVCCTETEMRAVAQWSGSFPAKHGAVRRAAEVTRLLTEMC